MGKLVDDLMHLEQDVKHMHDDVEHIIKDFEGLRIVLQWGTSGTI